MNQLTLWEIPPHTEQPPRKSSAHSQPDLCLPDTPNMEVGSQAILNPETLAWDILWEVADTDPEFSMAHACAICAVGSSATLAVYLGWVEEEAARQQELSQLYPDEASRHTHRYALLADIAARLRDLGLEP